ncbi:hypothetical protein [Streptomyces sp. NPDC048603]|uniref:hypothetical protein n=1 Tax=Streptomyces sp. NPDC048603 TaxID=3365577 RepID=UPI00371A3F9C
MAVLAGTLVASDTPVADIARYAFYVLWGVLLPGTLVYRALRRTPHTLIEDLALGAVTGLALELAAWAVLMSLGIQSVAVLWPLAVVVPFAAVPRLRRHWWVRGYARAPLGWSWAVAATTVITSGYLYRTYLSRNPILPTSETTKIFVDLPYQMSLAGNAKHNFPLTLPQVAGEPHEYHWFSFVHEAMTGMVGGLDLTVVQLRLMLPMLCALTMAVTAVVAWRLTGRAWAGPVAALLIFAIGEFNATPAWTPFGSPQTTLMVWASVSMTYSQPLLLALIGVAGDGLRNGGPENRVPVLGRRAVLVLVALFALASSAAKATSLPVVLAGLAVAGLALLIRTRRIPWTVVGMGAAVGAAQLFATAVIFRFKSYGLQATPFSNLQVFWNNSQELRSTGTQIVLGALVFLGFLLNTQLRMAGVLPLLWRGRLKLDAVQWFLLGGAIAGPGVYLTLNGWNSSYFTHAGLALGVILSAWGYCESFERARLSRRGVLLLALASAVFTLALTYLVVFRGTAFAERLASGLKEWNPDRHSLFAAGAGPARALVPILAAALLGALALAVVGLLWWVAGRRWTGLRGRFGIVVLTAALLAGAPALVSDLRSKPAMDPTVWGSFPLPASKVEAARWLRDHSRPEDVVATNEHCWSQDDFKTPQSACANRNAFALSGYAERSVLVEGWAFAPRLMATGSPDFWDQELLRKNDEAFTRPTAGLLAELRDRHGVRFLFVNRKAGKEAPELAGLTTKVLDNGRIGIYEIR